MTEQLKPCPFCGGGTTEITENGRVWTGMKWGEPSSVSVRHWCEEVPGQPSRMLERVGRDHEAAIAAWNRRSQPAQVGAEPVAWVVLQKTADEIVRSKSLWKRFIDGTPLENDIACWMADFAEQFSSHPPARVPLTDEELRMISKQQDPVVVLHHNVLAFAHAIIAAYEAKNGIGGGK